MAFDGMTARASWRRTELESYYLPVLINERFTKGLTGWVYDTVPEGHTGLVMLVDKFNRGNSPRGQTLRDLMARSANYVHELVGAL